MLVQQIEKKFNLKVLPCLCGKFGRPVKTLNSWFALLWDFCFIRAGSIMKGYCPDHKYKRFCWVYLNGLIHDLVALQNCL